MGSKDLDIVERLKQRSQKADDMIAVLRAQIAQLKRVALSKVFSEEIAKLKRDNDAMTAEVEQLKQRLIQAEVRNGIKQYPVPSPGISASAPTQQQNSSPSDGAAVAVSAAAVPPSTVETPVKSSTPKPVKTKEGKGSKSASDKPKEDDAPPDVSRLDFRVGRILTAKKHPSADSLYVEDVELGDGERREVVSGLVRFVPLDQMQNRLVVLLCNLKPAKMRGIVSQAMVMCASTPDAVEILVPPAGSVPGDRVLVQGYDGKPDAELNPKKKIFEQVAPDLKTDSKLVATYKGVPLAVPGKGVVMAPSLANVQIK